MSEAAKESKEPKGAEASYHHGDLPSALLAATQVAIAEHGVSAFSLRDVARQAGVSHAAPAHHFGNREGLLTAFAAEGFERFRDALRAVAHDEPHQRLRLQARAYVEFALANRSHFEVMWRPELCDIDEPTLVALRIEAYMELWNSVAASQAAGRLAKASTDDAVLACWAAVHGLAWLLLQEALPPGQDEGTVAELTDRITAITLA